MTEGERLRPQLNVVQGIAFRPGAVADIVPGLIGRDSELQALLNHLYRVIETGSAHLVTVSGMPGIGKSRLAYEFRQWVARLPEAVHFYTVQADEQTAQRPDSLVRAIVMTLFRISEGDTAARAHTRIVQGVTRTLGADSVEKAHIIGQAFGFDFSDSPTLRAIRHDTRQIRERALHYALQFMAAFTAQSPVVLVVEGLDQADDSSLDALRFLAEHGKEVGLLLLCLTRRRFFDRRPDWDEQLVNASRIALQPLTERDTRRLVGEILRKAGKLPLELRSLLIDTAEGNPYFLEELVRMLIADGVIVTGSDQWHVRAGRLSRLKVPGTLRDLLLTRLMMLPPAEREVLEQGAVLGRSFWVGALLAMGPALLEQDEMLALLHSLTLKELVVAQSESRFPDDSEYAFRHGLLAEVAYDRLSPTTRALLHGQAAEWLCRQNTTRGDEFAGPVADHFERAGLLTQAADYYGRAARRALLSGALDTAQRYVRKALAYLPVEPAYVAQRLDLLAMLGQILTDQARSAEAIGCYTEMRALAEEVGDLSAQVRAWNGLSLVYDVLAETSISLDSLQRTVELARRADDPVNLGIALVRWGWYCIRNDDATGALEKGTAALVLFEHLTDRAEAARARGMLAMAYNLQLRYNDAFNHLEAALAVHRSLSDLREVTVELNNIGYVANQCGDWERAERALSEALQIARETGNRTSEIYTLSNLCEAHVGLGAYTRAEEEARLGIHLCETSRIAVFADFYWAQAEALLGLGRVDEAVDAAQQGLEVARAREHIREIATALRVLGMAIAQLPDPAGAPPCFAESLRMFGELGAESARLRTLRAWARHELRSGDAARGAAMWHEAQLGFAQLGLKHEAARMPPVRGSAGQLGTKLAEAGERKVERNNEGCAPNLAPEATLQPPGPWVCLILAGARGNWYNERQYLCAAACASIRSTGYERTESRGRAARPDGGGAQQSWGTRLRYFFATA
ncbi:AAA family ATPase [Candidatus Gracilibacteria bacterium]|nr:AAA family ATPase [Candidatus Gracilibacteria bacterium]